MWTEKKMNSSSALIVVVFLVEIVPNEKLFAKWFICHDFSSNSLKLSFKKSMIWILIQKVCSSNFISKKSILGKCCNRIYGGPVDVQIMRLYRNHLITYGIPLDPVYPEHPEDIQKSGVAYRSRYKNNEKIVFKFTWLG